MTTKTTIQGFIRKDYNTKALMIQTAMSLKTGKPFLKVGFRRKTGQEYENIKVLAFGNAIEVLKASPNETFELTGNEIKTVEFEDRITKKLISFKEMVVSEAKIVEKAPKHWQEKV